MAALLAGKGVGPLGVGEHPEGVDDLLEPHLAGVLAVGHLQHAGLARVDAHALVQFALALDDEVLALPYQLRRLALVLLVAADDGDRFGGVQLHLGAVGAVAAHRRLALALLVESVVLLPRRAAAGRLVRELELLGPEAVEPRGAVLEGAQERVDGCFLA